MSSLARKLRVTAVRLVSMRVCQFIIKTRICCIPKQTLLIKAFVAPLKLITRVGAATWFSVRIYLH